MVDSVDRDYELLFDRYNFIFVSYKCPKKKTCTPKTIQRLQSQSATHR
jgi:hypothetical protein